MKLSNVAALTLMSIMAAGQALAADAPPPPPPHEEGKPGGPGGPGGPRHFQKVDANGDGIISKDEWRAQGDRMFNEIDANHDGKITPEEMKSFHDAKRAEFKEHREARGEKGMNDGPPPPAGDKAVLTPAGKK